MIGIINYGAGNIFSLSAALERLGIVFKMVNDVNDFDSCTKYIIPGVGHAKPAMQKLQETGLIPLIKQTKKPVLGICLGMQLLTAFSEEGETDLLNLIPLKTLLFDKKSGIKIPHMGWNNIEINNDSSLFHNIPDKSYFYFVHSYFIEYSTNFTITSTSYGIPFTSAMQNENFYGVQFHPEKSGNCGEQLLINFNNL